MELADRWYTGYERKKTVKDDTKVLEWPVGKIKLLGCEMGKNARGASLGEVGISD